MRCVRNLARFCFYFQLFCCLIPLYLFRFNFKIDQREKSMLRYLIGVGNNFGCMSFLYWLIEMQIIAFAIPFRNWFGHNLPRHNLANRRDVRWRQSICRPSGWTKVILLPLNQVVAYRAEPCMLAMMYHVRINVEVSMATLRSLLLWTCIAVPLGAPLGLDNLYHTSISKKLSAFNILE